MNYTFTPLTHISELPELVYLWWKNCIRLKSISSLPKLEELYCNGCTSLTFIPLRLKSLYCEDCRWLYRNEEFKDNIRALRVCQGMWKRKVLGRKLDRVIPILSEFYYSPGCKGEYLASRAFLTKAKKLHGTLTDKK